MSEPFCCRCKENFPIENEPVRWQMGKLRTLKKAPQRFQQELQGWLDSEIHGEGYLCGNCYFDMKDEEESW